MGWKCDDCGDRGPESCVIFCPDCGSRNVAATDADGLTAADRFDQFQMNCEEFGIDPASVIYVDTPARFVFAPPAPRPSNDNFPLHPERDDSIPF